MSKLSADEIKKRYALGEKNFRQVELSFALLRGVDLSHSDLSESTLLRTDLNGANLSRVQLFDANLTKAKLNAAHLKGAYLTKSCLNEVELIGACLEEAHLNGVELKRANLTGADLSDAYLIGANLSGANLTGANLCGANLSGANLTGANLCGAYYSDNTYIDAGFKPHIVEMIKLKTTTVEELLITLNYLYQASNKYLGSKLTANYLESSRPDFDWLNKFQINRSDGITFSGVLTKPVNPIQLKWCQEWINAFINRCSQVIQDFPSTIDRGQLIWGGVAD